MNTLFNKILMVIGSLSLVLIILLTSVELIAFNKQFYMKQMDKNNVAANIKVSRDDLEDIVEKIINYLKKGDNLNIVKTVDKEERGIFNEQEKTHMVDVVNLIDKGFFNRNMLIFSYVIIAIFAILKKQLNIFLKIQERTIGFSIVFISVLVFIINFNFNKYFTIFHEIFFKNELWLLDPKTSILINILPLEFFISIAIAIGVTFLLLLGIVVVICRKLYNLKEKS